MYYRRAAFTLIELMVVVAVLMLLLAILLPSLQKAKEIARCAKCASSLRGIGLLVTQYAFQEDQTFPLRQSNIYPTSALYGSEVNWTWRKWMENAHIVDDADNIGKTSGNNRRFYCPSNTSGDSYPHTALGTKGAFGGGSCNANTTPAPPERWRFFEWRRIHQVRRPYETLTVMKGSGRWTVDADQGGWLTDIHNDGSNFLFVDQHVQFQFNEWARINGVYQKLTDSTK